MRDQRSKGGGMKDRKSTEGGMRDRRNMGDGMRKRRREGGRDGLRREGDRALWLLRLMCVSFNLNLFCMLSFR